MRGVSDRPSRSDDLDPEHSDRFDAGRDGPLGHERIVAELRKAAETFQPDDERIRQLINARTGGDGPLRTAGPVPSFHRVSARRRLMWPVAGSAAAAAVILAVFARGVLPGTAGGVGVAGSGSRDGGGSVTIGVAPASENGSNGSSTSPATSPPTGSVTSSTPAPTASPTPSGSTVRPTHRPSPSGSPASGATTTPGTSGPTSGASTGARPTTSRAVASASPSTTRVNAGGRELSISVRPVPVGLTADMVTPSPREWIAATDSASGKSFYTNSSSALGPLQLNGSGYATAPGPFTVHRPDLASGATVTSTAWLTIPGLTDGVRNSVRLPVRYHQLPATATLYVGTASGPGRITFTVTATDGTQGTPVTIDLPTCEVGTCPAVVTMTVAAGTDTSVTSGTIHVDLAAVNASGRIGFAGGTLR